MPQAQRPHASGFAEVGETQLYYDEAGARHPLVLIHGGLLTNRAWDEQVPVFAQRYRVIRYDVRGHSLSAMPPAPYSNHRDLYDLLRFLQIDHGYVLGHSMGGRIALNLALAYPEMVDALILVGAGVDGYPFSDAVDKRHEEMRAAHQRGDVDAAAEIFLHLWVDGPRRTPEDVGPAVRWRTREMAMHNLMLPPARGIPEPLEPAAASRLNEIHCPTLVIVGDQDVPDNLAIADLLLLPGLPRSVSRPATAAASATWP